MKKLHFLGLLALAGGLVPVGCGGGNDAADGGPDAGAAPDYTTGAACTTDADCGSNGSGTCLQGFQLYNLAPAPTIDDPLVMIGLSHPGGYCSNASTCATDADCGTGGACFRPLEGATDTSELHSSTVTDLSALGVCLEACTQNSDCREAEGYRCQVPLQSDLASVSDRSTDTYCIQDETPPCQIAAASVPAGKCQLRYDLQGSFQITDTLAGQGDATRVIGPGTLILEVDRDAGGDVPSTADGDVSFLCYQMQQRMEVASVVTAVDAVATGGGAVATGAFSGDTIDMQVDCTYGATYGIDKYMWNYGTTTATGTSCLSNYSSVGDVICPLGTIGCAAGGLDADHNLQDATWIQPLNDITLTNGAGDFSAIAMAGDGNPDRWTPLAVCAGLGLEQPGTNSLGYGVTCDSGTWKDASGTLLDLGQTTDPDFICYVTYCNLPDDKVEIPDDNPSRTFLSFTGALVETVCTAP